MCQFFYAINHLMDRSTSKMTYKLFLLGRFIKILCIKFDFIIFAFLRRRDEKCFCGPWLLLTLHLGIYKSCNKKFGHPAFKP